MRTTIFSLRVLIAISKKCLSILSLLFIMKPLVMTVLFAQPVTPITGPSLHWSQDQWYDMPATAQTSSGEDWYYDFIPYFEGGILNGYAGFGFSSSVNDNGNFNCFDCAIGLVEQVSFERTGYEIGCSYPKIAEMDKQGNVEWYKTYTKGVGFFRAGVQLDDESGYVGVGFIKYDGGNGINYNPGIHDQGFPLDLCEGGIDPYYNLLYIVKTDAEGNMVEEAVYGLGLPELAHLQDAHAYGIIQDKEDHSLIVVGFASEGGQRKAFVMKIDKNSLGVVWRKTIIPAGSYSSHATCVVEMADNYYIAGTKDYNTGVPSHGKINIVKLSSSGLELETFELNEITTGDTDIDDHFVNECTSEDFPISTSAAYNLVINNGDLLVAAEVKRANAIQGTRAEALGKVYRINLTGIMSWEKTILLVETGGKKLLSYDLKIGLTNTYDGGYAITSSMHDADLFGTCVNSSITYYPGNTYTFDYDLTKSWNADAYIAKFNSIDEMQWRATYPIVNGYGATPTYFPNDIKHSECIYEIVEADDHGLVVGGNNSKNFDDDMVIKIYNDCSIYTAYNTGVGDIDVVGTQNYYGSGNLWNTNKKVRGIIQINAGATLTINNAAIIEFADSKSANHPTYILVKRGGRLIIEGGAKLTSNNGCNVMWEGIYVEGSYGINHPTPASFMAAGYTNASHGFVWLKTGATIENARRGVSLGLPTEMGSFPNFGGGIIIADDANFINNAYDIYFHPFNKSNVSFIRHCDFITNGILKDELEYPVAHIYMIQVKNVIARGNYFENITTESVYAGLKRGDGVRGFISAFTVNDNSNGFGLSGLTGSDPNIFKKLYYGVNASQGPLVSNNIIVDGNTFENNNRGVYLGSTLLAEVNRNTFTILASGKINYGLYIDGSTGYGIEENIFTGPGANVANSPTGLIVNQSGISNNIVYRNTFNALKYGTKTQGNNGNSTDGLEYKCNTFTNNKYDLALLSQGAITATMKKNQGACGTLNSPGNNLLTDYSYIESLAGKQILVYPDDASNYYYYTFHRDLFPVLAPFAAPGWYSDKVDPALHDILGFSDEFGCTEFNFDPTKFATDYCPTSFPSGGGGGGGRMSNPSSGTKFDRHFNPLNPYNLAKVSGDDTEAEDYASFIENIGFNMLASYYMQAVYTDSLSVLVESNGSLLAQSIEAEIAVDSGNYTDATEIVEEIDGELTADAEGYSTQIQNISVDLATDTLTWLQVAQDDFETMKAISENDDRESIQAKLIVEYITGENYEEPVYGLDDEVYDDELRYIKDHYPLSELNSINIYPHPVSNGSIVEINLEYLSGNDIFIIVDISGRTIAQYLLEENISYIKLNNRMLQPGIYIGYTQSDGVKLISKQIVVVK